MRPSENKLTMTLETCGERDWRNDRRIELFAKSHQTIALRQDSSQFLDVAPLSDVTITISVIEGPSRGLVYEMIEPCITLGRVGGGADFQFNEREASEIQCIVATRQNGVRLYDAVSIHGTYVNDQRIAAAELTDMSTFRVGSSLLLVRVRLNQPTDSC